MTLYTKLFQRHHGPSTILHGNSSIAFQNHSHTSLWEFFLSLEFLVRHFRDNKVKFPRRPKFLERTSMNTCNLFKEPLVDHLLTFLLTKHLQPHTLGFISRTCFLGTVLFSNCLEDSPQFSTLKSSSLCSFHLKHLLQFSSFSVYSK